ncbi:MAG: choice-of-anchor Q domain-containing protein, partial [Runella zeae]
MKNVTLLPKIIFKKLPLLLGFIAFCIQSYAYPPVSIIYVKQNASGANNGTSWTDAYTSLQTAITNASAGTQIWVAAGTYKPTTGTDRDITFSLKNDVAIYGGFPNTGNPTFDDRNWHTNVTILSGEIGTSAVEDNSRRIIFNDNINSSAILDGFTIRDAYNTSTFSGAEGGGLRNQNSSPTILNCIFRNNNIANSGGGVANMSSSSPTYTNCLFIGNYAGYHGGASCSVGGSNPSFINCSFFGNTAGVYGGALFNNASGTNTTLKNCIVWGNTSSDNSVFYKSSGTVTVTYSLVQDGYTGTGNINTDPLFVDATNGDFRLQQCSPAINVGEDAANSTTLDLGKNTRKVGFIDMGAYEYQSAGGVPTAYAVNGSGDFCEGGTGVEITMSNVRPAVSYQLKRDNINVGTPIAGSLTTFGYHNQAGTYTVVATSLLNGCTNTMSNTISINNLPTAYNVGGGGSF